VALSWIVASGVAAVPEPCLPHGQLTQGYSVFEGDGACFEALDAARTVPRVVGSSDNGHLYAMISNACSDNVHLQHINSAKNANLGAIMDNSLSFIIADVNTFDEDGFEIKFPCTELVPASLTPLKAPRKSHAPPFAEILAKAQGSELAQRQIETAMSVVSRDSLEFYNTYLSEEFFTRHRSSADGQRSAEWSEQTFEAMGLSAELHDIGVAGMFPNVIATHLGTTFADEIVVIGAHLDSRMQDNNDATSRAPGADDNGSGSAGVLEIARILSEMQFERTIVFALWGGEEGGLIGSRAWAGMAADEGQDIVAYLNFDMMGFTLPGQPITLGIRDRFTTPDLFDFVNKTTVDFTGLPIGLSTGCCSDYQAFFEVGYPAMALFENPTTAGSYPDYHATGDVVANLNFEQMVAFTQAWVANTMVLASPL